VPASPGTARARASARPAGPVRRTGRDSSHGGAMLKGDRVAALGPVTPGLAQPRGAGDPPHCGGPAIRAQQRAGSDRRRAPESHGADGDPRPAAPARARPTAPGEDDSGDTGRRSGTPVRSPAGHQGPMASGRRPTPARDEPQGREAGLGRRAREWLGGEGGPGRPHRPGPLEAVPASCPTPGSRAARVESEGYPKQRAVSCIQSNLK